MMLPSHELNALLLANAGEPAEFGVGLLLMTIVSFIILFSLLSRFAIKPTLTALSNRETQIKESIESAKKERAEAEKLAQEQRTAITQARQEATEQIRKTQADMEKFREELMAKARKEADDLKADARRTIEEERVKAVNEVKAEAVRLSILVAEKLLAEKLDDSKHQQLAQQFMTDLAKKQTPTA